MDTKRRLSLAVFQVMVAVVLFFVFINASQAQGDKIDRNLQQMLDEARQSVDSITIEELSDMIAEEHKLVLVDVRTEAEYEAGHLRGAMWIPRGKLEFVAAREKLGLISDDIVVYCKQGSRSSLAGGALKRLGFENVRYLKGGFKPWVTSGRSIYNIHGELFVSEFEKSEQE
jgi:rhodanese-related sulfurtransferase